MSKTKRVRNYLKRPDGAPWPYASVVIHAVDRIHAASVLGEGLRLTGEEVRALDWAIIHIGEEGEPAQFRERACGEDTSNG